MTDIVFTVPGRIGGKQRPRFSTRGGQIRAFTPAKTRNAEKLIRDYGHDAMCDRMALEGPISLSVTITLNPPTSWAKKKQRAADWVTGKPDADNVLKLIGDSLNGICWRDDSQIAQVYFSRHYKMDQAEQVEISIRSLLRDPVELIQAMRAA